MSNLRSVFCNVIFVLRINSRDFHKKTIKFSIQQLIFLEFLVYNFHNKSRFFGLILFSRVARPHHLDVDVTPPPPPPRITLNHSGHGCCYLGTNTCFKSNCKFSNNQAFKRRIYRIGNSNLTFSHIDLLKLQ